MIKISPIIIFAMVSVGIHVGLIIISNDIKNIARPSTTSTTASAIVVRIIKTKIEAIQDTARNYKEKRIVTVKSSKEKIITLTNNIKVAVKRNTIKKQRQTAPSEKKEVKSAISKPQVISIINKELEQYFIYPKLAQKFNWQGKVLLSLRVKPNGEIDDVQIISSSGHTILDNAAIQSLLKVKYLEQISSLLSNDIYLQLPIIYQLTES